MNNQNDSISFEEAAGVFNAITVGLSSTLAPELRVLFQAFLRARANASVDQPRTAALLNDLAENIERGTSLPH